MITQKGVAVPATLDDLVKPAYKGLLVVEDPATSSPGLAFMLATVARYGESGWRDYWSKLRANDVKVDAGWVRCRPPAPGWCRATRCDVIVDRLSIGPIQAFVIAVADNDLLEGRIGGMVVDVDDLEVAALAGRAATQCRHDLADQRRDVVLFVEHRHHDRQLGGSTHAPVPAQALLPRSRSNTPSSVSRSL